MASAVATESLEVELRPLSIAIFNVAMIGHVNPTFPLVSELVRRGCKVHYFLPPNDDIRAAALQCGASVEAYMLGDPQDFELEKCGLDELPDNVPEGEEALWERATWPLASALQCGAYVISRCCDLGVQAVLYDPMAPHGLLVSGVLGIPCMSLVTYPGMGALAPLMAHPERQAIARAVRLPLSKRIKTYFGVDLHDEYITRRQYFAEHNLITTSEDLVAPLPIDGEAPWADEIREHFRFEAVGCMVDPAAPHVTGARAAAAASEAPTCDFGRDLPEQDLDEAKRRGDKVIYAALGTMALSSRWASDLGRASGGNLPMGTTGKEFCQHVWRALLRALELLGDGYLCVLCVGTQPDALDFMGDAVPKNVIIRSSIPQVEMLSTYADIFVSHVGFNSLQESVHSGVPLIAIPQAVDQPSNARLAETAGWGRAFLQPMDSVCANSLRDAILDLTAPGATFVAAVKKSQAMLKGGEQRAADRLINMALCGTCEICSH